MTFICYTLSMTGCNKSKENLKKFVLIFICVSSENVYLFSFVLVPLYMYLMTRGTAETDILGKIMFTYNKPSVLLWMAIAVHTLQYDLNQYIIIPSLCVNIYSKQIKRLSERSKLNCFPKLNRPEMNWILSGCLIYIHKFCWSLI